MRIIRRLRLPGAHKRETSMRSRRLEEMVRDDERVLNVLIDFDGYAWQGDVASALDWSAVKTSRIVSKMEAEGLVTRYQIGRRKIVCVPELEPDILRRNDWRALAP